MSPHDFNSNQGRNDPESLKASRAALGLPPDEDPFQNKWVRLVCFVLVLIALGAVVKGWM